MNVFTIGYEGLDLDSFMALLKKHRIETIVDIRELPLSRKPGFSKNALRSVLNLSGVEYVHMVELGCPRQIRDRYKSDNNWSRYEESFLEYLDTQESVISELSAMVNSSHCALLCYEADFNYCHRSLVANSVREYCGVAVQHIDVIKAKKEILGSHQHAYV